MRKLIPSRRLTALLAAYVIALQALLLPLTVAAHAAPEEGLCVSAKSGGAPRSTTSPDRSPARHDSGCACAAGCGMQCHAPALAGAPSIAFAAYPLRVSMAAPAPPVTAVIRPPHRTPLVARAPPLV
jgi:hypothetical protein